MNAPVAANQLPAHVARLPQQHLAQAITASLGTSSPPYVSLMGNAFTLVDAAGNEQRISTFDPKLGVYLDCTIVAALERVSKIFYDTVFDPGAQSYMPPGCWSDNGVGPSRQAANPQSLTCAACPNATWGSDTSKVTGKQIKACSDYQKIAVSIPGFPDTVFLLRIPPNSLKNFRAYAAQFHGQPFDMTAVVTRLSFQQGTLGTLVFAPIGYIDEAMAGVVTRVFETKAADSMLGRHDLPREGGLPAPTPAAQIAGPAPVYAPLPHAQVAVPVQMIPAQHAPAPQQSFQGFQPQPFQPAVQVQQPVMTVSPVTGNAQMAYPPNPQPAEPTRRRRRTQAQIAADNAVQGQPQPVPTQAPFMPQQLAPTQVMQPAPFQPAPAQQGQQPSNTPVQFGVAGSVPPNAEVAGALASLFGPPQT